MKTSLEFRSDQFPPCDGEEDQINPGCWGKRLAEYLQRNLKTHGFDALEIIPEDWGWCVPVQNKEFSLWIGCGHQSGDDDQFLCFIQPDKPFIRRWFRKIDTTEHISRLAEALEAILSSNPAIRNLRWLAKPTNFLPE
jgi:hypothetical protein